VEGLPEPKLLKNDDDDNEKVKDGDSAPHMGLQHPLPPGG
jgi:hypothetical protein